MSNEKVFITWCCHHGLLIEICYDYKGRIKSIIAHKPAKEVPVRLYEFQKTEGKIPDEVIEAAIAYAEALKARDEAYKVWEEAGKAYDEACKAYDEAWKAYDEARTAYDEACKAYDEAWKAYDEARTAYAEAGTVYDEACKACEVAWRAYEQVDRACDEALRAYKEIIAKHRDYLEKLHREEVPDTCWNGRELDFKKSKYYEA